MTPTVHLNGTSREALENQLEQNVTALRAALRTLGENNPNQRDYPGDLWKLAQADHRRRLQTLTDLINEYATEWERLVDRL